jgi:hypothetical protein
MLVTADRRSAVTGWWTVKEVAESKYKGAALGGAAREVNSSKA